MKAKFVHTNLIAEDWKSLSDFYIKVFNCSIVPPERDFKSKKLEAGTGIPDAALKGVHLRLPGWGKDGPTLEIFQYNHQEKKTYTAVNRPGYGHIAFAVDDVELSHDEVLRAGGKSIGEIVTLDVKGGAKVKWVYVADPEGNVIELQAWEK